jgi:hypothetical protein
MFFRHPKFPSSFPIAALILASSFSGAHGFVGQWHSYVNQENIVALQGFDGYMFAGTTGGVRKINPGDYSETSYANLEGLLDVSIVGFGVAAGHLWAVSRSGFVQEWDGRKFTGYGRAYEAERWRMNTRAALGVNKYLVLGSDRGLSFFDADRKIALVSLTRIGDLVGPSVLSLAVKGDTLFVGMAQGIYKAAMDWNNITSDRISIYDPNIWTRVEAPGKVDALPVVSDSDTFTPPDSIPDKKFDHLAFVDGKLRFFGRGTHLESPYRVDAFFGSRTYIDGDTLPWDIPYEAAATLNGTLFLGSQWLLIATHKPVGPNLGFTTLQSTRTLPNDAPQTVVAAAGRVFFQSAGMIYQKDGERWNRYPGYGLPVSVEIADRSLKNLTADKDGSVFVGTWGLGIARLSQGRQVFWSNQTDACMDTVVNNYTVIQSISDPDGASVWATVHKEFTATTFQVVHLDVARDRITCLGAYGSTLITHSLKPLAETAMGVATKEGVEVFQHDAGGSGGFKHLKTLTTSGQGNEVWDLAPDAFGRVWSVLGEKLTYVDSVFQVTGNQQMKLLEPFDGKECKIMEGDLQKNLWVGCSNGLFRVAPAANIEAVQVTRYTLDDGLLSNNIFDVSVDKGNGQVWLATDRGMAMFEASAKAAPGGLGDLKVYPNPFRPNHRYVIFDNIPSGGSVAIHTESGSVVRRFPPSQVSGNQCQWDGNNAAGRKVSPGVYLYSVVAGSKVKQGKIIVAR